MKDDAWWTQKREEVENTKGMKEGIQIREELALAYSKEGMLKEASKMWEDAAILSAQFPETIKYSDKYFDKSLALKNKFESDVAVNGGGNYFSKLVIFIAIFGIVGGILFLTPNLLTGNVIVDEELTLTNWVGTGLVIVGVLFGISVLLKR